MCTSQLKVFCICRKSKCVIVNRSEFVHMWVNEFRAMEGKYYKGFLQHKQVINKQIYKQDQQVYKLSTLCIFIRIIIK